MYKIRGPRGPILIMTRQENVELSKKVGAIQDDNLRSYCTSTMCIDSIVLGERPNGDDGLGLHDHQ